MNRDELRMALETALTGRRLLSHPFYRRWVRGELTVDDLRGYAEQYRCFEASLPVTLGRVRDGISDGAVRAIVQGNLDDETGAEGISHLELFERFMGALDARRDGNPGGAMAHLLSTYDALTDGGPVGGLSALLAYEVQVPEIAVSKAAGLTAHHGMSQEQVAFWNVHASIDGAHAEWLLEGLARLEAPAAEVAAAARTAADSWWEFLDECEARLAVPARG